MHLAQYMWGDSTCQPPGELLQLCPYCARSERHLPSPPVKFKQDRSLYPLGPDSGTPDLSSRFTRVHIKIKGTCGTSLEVGSGYRKRDDGPGHSAHMGLTGRTSGRGRGPDRSTGSYAGTAGAFLHSTPLHSAPDPEHPEGTHEQKKQPEAWLSWRGESAGAAAPPGGPTAKASAEVGYGD